MNVSNLPMVINAAKQAGFTGASLITAVAIAAAESGFDPDAMGDVNLQNQTWGPSVGLFQIRSLHNPLAYSYPDTLRVADALRDPVYNAQAAYAISKKGTDFAPWSTFTNGAFQQFVSLVTGAEDIYTEVKKNPLALLLLLVIFGAIVLTII